VYLLVPSLRVGIRLFLLALENAGRPDWPVASRTEIDVTRSDVEVIRRSAEPRRLDLANIVALDDRSPFFDRSSAGDGQHYRAILIADPSYIFPKHVFSPRFLTLNATV